MSLPKRSMVVFVEQRLRPRSRIGDVFRSKQGMEQARDGAAKGWMEQARGETSEGWSWQGMAQVRNRQGVEQARDRA